MSGFPAATSGVEFEAPKDDPPAPFIPAPEGSFPELKPFDAPYGLAGMG